MTASLPADPDRREAIFNAARDAIGRHLKNFDFSAAHDDLWENNPELVMEDAEAAQLLAIQLATMMAETLPPLPGSPLARS